MPKFLIEVPHDNNQEACDQAVRVFKQTGSHFLTNADWGCSDDIHKAWIIIDVDNKNEALLIVPQPYREKARAITLNKFAFDGTDESLNQHQT
ncbi:MAG TPA: hypothetical protein VJ242_00940 [Patescibacteria group bacterium]|nr:hypothetical protein [Patescibacteria group bacterium]